MSSAPRLRRQEWIAAALAAVVGFVLWDWFFRPAAGGLDAVGHPVGRDFLNTWAAPRLAFSGRLSVLFDLDGYWRAVQDLYGARFGKVAWSYPPPALLLFAPFSVLPYGWSLGLWTVTSWAAFLPAALGPVARELRLKAGALIVLAPGALMSGFTGQNGLFTGAMLLGGLQLMAKRPWLAGVLFGLLTVKPQLGLVLPFVLLALRAWKTIASATLTAIAMAALSFAVFGLAPWKGYLEVSAPYSAWVLAQPGGGQKLLLVSLASALTQWGVSFNAALAVQAVVAVAVVVVTVLGVLRSADRQHRIALIICASALATPYGWTYDLAALSAVMAWRLVGARTDPAWKSALWTLGYLAPMLTMALELFGIAAGPWMLAAVFAGLGWEALKPPATCASNNPRSPLAT